MAGRNNNYIPDIIEEIALEGLDGLTINALWTRLNDRPCFVIKPVDNETKKFLWQVVRQLSCVNFYLLPEPRKPLVLYNRFKYVDASGNFYEPDDIPESIYPHSPVDDNGIVGSCATYKSRSEITAEVRTKSLDEAVKRWGEALVIVANQASRKLALSVPDFNPITEITLLNYCFLERIGRSRYNGEVTQGKCGLQTISEDSKMLFYYRKFLSKHNLITKQVFHLRVAKFICAGSLLHLPKFCTVIKSKCSTDLVNIIQYIKDKPEKYAIYKEVQKHFGASIELKKVLIKLSKVIKIEMLPYRTVHPDAKPSEWKVKSNGSEKSVKTLRLIESSVPENMGEEDDDEEVEENGLLNESGHIINRSILSQCYSAIEKAGGRGLTQAGVSSAVAITALQARSICKQLVKKNMCRLIMIDVGRQRVGHFVSKKFDFHKSSMVNEVSKEKNKLLKIISNSEENSKSDEIKAGTSENSADSSEVISKPSTSAVEKNTEEMDKIEMEIFVSKLNNSGIRSFPSLTEEVKSLDPSSTTNSLTYRILKRANLIMQAVNTHKVIHDPQKLQRLINEEEESEGFHYNVDRKTVLRLMEKLEADGHIKIIKVNLKGYGREKNMVFICHPTVTEDYSEIKSAIEQAKMKLPIITRKSIKAKNPKWTDPLLGAFTNTKTTLYKYKYKAGRTYGFKPKFVRMKILHTFMFYLIYGYEGKDDLNQEESKRDLVKKLDLDPSLVEEMENVYHVNDGWKMFIPPLPVHQDYEDGWCLMSDLLLRLPLCLFVALMNVPYDIPQLHEYINHPIRKYYLVRHVPTDIANQLTIMRKYIFAISDIVLRLCYIGLVQMGPQRLKEKDQVFIYLNRNACLLDTTPSDVGYIRVSENIKYDVSNYTFKTMDDIDQYWYDLWNFAMNTNLGCRNAVTGQSIVLEPINTKSILLAATRPRTPREAKEKDVGHIPGDGFGAGGLDSDMFVHLKRNWYWNSDIKCEPDSFQKFILDPPSFKRPPIKTDVHKGTTEGKLPLDLEPKKTEKRSSQSVDVNKISKDGTVKQVGPPRKKIKKSSQNEVVKINTLKKPWKRHSKPKKVTRIVKPKTTKLGRKPYYDQVDREALRRMVKLRVEWSSQEDNLLLVCKVASLFICPNKRRHILRNFCAVREILHSAFPETSRNKTSRACQRRMLYMMKNPSTVHSVYLCLEEIKQDDEIIEKFGKAVENLDTLLKAQGEGLKLFQKKYDEIFTNLVHTLTKKLKTVQRSEKTGLVGITIPKTKQEFYNMFNVVIPRNLLVQGRTFNEIQNTVDIFCGVINGVIHSSLCSYNDKTNYSYQLFHIYQQYPDKLLRSVMAKCRSMSIVSCRKRCKRWKTANDTCLPLSSSPYQLSITYVNILQTRYQYQIFSECYASLQYIITKQNEKENNVLSNPDEAINSNNDLAIGTDPLEDSQVLIDEKQDLTGYIDMEISSGGDCANIVELYSAGFIKMVITFPEHLIMLDPIISKDKDNYFQLMERFRELISMGKGPNKKQNDSDVMDDKINDDDDDFDDDDGLCDEAAKNADENNDEFNLANNLGAAKAASRLAVYMMRDEPLESLDKSLQHAHDYFVLNPCKISVRIDNMEEAISKVIDDKRKEKILNNLKKFAVFPECHVGNNDIINEVETSSHSLNVNLLRQVLEFLELKKELGATYIDIEDNVGTSRDIQSILDILVDGQYVLKSGTVNVRFIHNKFTKPWLIRSYFIPRTQRDSMPPEQAQVVCFSDESNPQKKIKLDDEKSNGNKPALNYNPKDNQHNVESKSISTSVSMDDQEVEINRIQINSSNSNLHENKSNNSENIELKNVGNPTITEDGNKDCEKEENKLSDTSSSRVVLQHRKRKWINLSKSSIEKLTNLDYSQMINVHILIRPWIRVDGTLNRRVLDRLLGSVLGHCLFVPGVTIEKLQSRFSPALQPVHTLELVQILEKLGCLHLCVVKSLRKPSLFSQRSDSYTAPFTGFEKLSSTIIEPELLAVSKLGHFIGEKAYKIDYLEKITNFKLLCYS